MDKSFWKGVLQAVTIALLLGLMKMGWNTYLEILELRHDVDALYSIVDDVAKKQ